MARQSGRADQGVGLTKEAPLSAVIGTINISRWQASHMRWQWRNSSKRQQLVKRLPLDSYT